MDLLREEVKEFRRPQALGYPVAGLLCVLVMAMATGVRQGPDDLAQFADGLRDAQLRTLGFRRNEKTQRYRTPRKTTFHRLLAKVDPRTLEPVLLRWQTKAGVRTPNAARVLGMVRRIVVSLSNAAVDRVRQSKPKAKCNTKSFRQQFHSARGGRERLDALIFAKVPQVLDLGE